jgi:erythromycin esterase-like protein
VRGEGHDRFAIDALADFTRFPHWMWRNTEVLAFVGWLREHNESRPAAQRVGFYGLDLYSLYSSIEAVINYLERTDPEASRRARQRYSCLDHVATDPAEYGFEVSLGIRPSCESEAICQLTELRRRAGEHLRRDGLVAEDEPFVAEQNARLIANAEEYYRGMFSPRINTWNLRDRHMADTLTALTDHLRRQAKERKIVVWTHNSHVGDARATDRREIDEWNVGQLMRERYGSDAVLVGLTTYQGTVSAASDWGQPVDRKNVRPALDNSYEAWFHQSGIDRFLLIFTEGELADQLREPLLQRAIGVVYRPQTERLSHYLFCRLPDQFDVVLHFDQTHALEPLDRTAQWEAGELPETYPFGV